MPDNERLKSYYYQQAKNKINRIKAMQLVELLNRIPVLETKGRLALSEVEVSELVFDSRKVSENSLYIALHLLSKKVRQLLFAKNFREI